MAGKLLSQRSPALFFVAVWAKRLRRLAAWHGDGRRYARVRTRERLPFAVKSHQSPLIRKLAGSDPQLQINKVTNLRLAAACLDGIVIAPGEVFSFYRLVGRPRRSRGFLPGLELAGGKARAGTGGGLCQLASLLHWLALHSPLTVSEHHHHSFDVFPDDNRVQPFGSGATVFYNYLDYQLVNDTPYRFQFSLAVTDRFLEGRLLCDSELPFAFAVVEDKHAFVRKSGVFYRSNEIWQVTRSAPDGAETGRRLVTRNFAKMMYEPERFTDIAAAEEEA